MIGQLYSKHRRGESLAPNEIEILTEALADSQPFKTRLYACTILLERNLLREDAVGVARQLVLACVEGSHPPDLMLTFCLHMLSHHEIQADDGIKQYAELAANDADEDNRVNAMTLVGHLILAGEVSLVKVLEDRKMDACPLVRQAAVGWLNRLRKKDSR